MEQKDKNLQSIYSNEMKNRFLNYAMSVIVSRALPVVNDGLKPVHRRILYAMHELHLYPEKAYKKSARIVGEVIGKFHPHGDVAVYEAMTKMIQNFNSNYPLIDGHGNFGSIDGDSPAAMRYTEVRLSKLAMSILKDLKKDTVDFIKNYDGSEIEPSVLPGLIPNLLINGTIGIAVGMATSIPPHNLVEVVNSIIHYLKNPQITVETLVNKQIFNGPDFPTKGLIVNNKQDIINFYNKGHGSIKMRGRYHLEENERNQKVIFTEIPYQVNKSNLIKNIVVLIKNKRLEQILDLRDESNRFGIRIVVILKKGAQLKVFLKRLFKLTSLNINFSMNMLALHENQPQIMNLLTIFKHYTNHQIDILVRKTKFNLLNDQQKLEILEGLQKALQNIDLVISLIKKSKTQKEAQISLQTTLQINERQSKAILEMRLQRLTGLEQGKINLEIQILNQRIEENTKILNDPEYQKEIIIEMLKTLKKEHSKKRQTEIVDNDQFTNINEEDLIEDKDVLICLTENNYLKAMDLKNFRAQNRGGVGIRGIKLNEKDVIRKIFHANVHDNLLFFTENGKVFRLKAYKIPELGRNTKGIPAQNLINIDKNHEKIINIICVDRSQEKENELFFVTKNGIVKKTPLKEFKNIRTNGKIAIKLKDQDHLKFIHLIDGEMDAVIAKNDNRIVRFNINDNLRSLSRPAKGVIGAKLTSEKNEVVSSSCCFRDQKILTISSNGKGKLLKVTNIRKTKKGALGVKVVKNKNELVNNRLVSSLSVQGNERLLIAKTSGRFMITDLKQIKIRKSRSSSGAKIVNLEKNEKICALCIYKNEEQ